MCVAVILEPETALTVEEVEKMHRSNADGVGVAWADGAVVHWYKTTKVDLRYITRMIQHYADFPRFVHFRFATAGGTRPDLCHPFEIGPLATCKPIHETNNVMMHNGHWGRWSEVYDIARKENLLPDNGPWSDTRLVAWLANHDPDWLLALGGRVATMDGQGKIATLGSWDDLRPGIRVSNKAWEFSPQYKRGGYTGYKNWKGWDWDDVEYAAWQKEQEDMVKAEMEANMADGEIVDVAAGHKSRKSKKERREDIRAAQAKQNELDTTNHGNSQPESVIAIPVQSGQTGDIQNWQAAGYAKDQDDEDGEPGSSGALKATTIRSRSGRILSTEANSLVVKAVEGAIAFSPDGYDGQVAIAGYVSGNAAAGRVIDEDEAAWNEYIDKLKP